MENKEIYAIALKEYPVSTESITKDLNMSNRGAYIRGYTDSTHHNHASFVALVEREIAKLWVGGNIVGANRAVYNTLKNLLTKIK